MKKISKAGWSVGQLVGWSVYFSTPYFLQKKFHYIYNI